MYFGDPQLQVGGNWSYLFNLKANICKYWCLNTHLISNNSDIDAFTLLYFGLFLYPIMAHHVCHKAIFICIF